MRVIAGSAKGHHLKSPKGGGTRPTSDKVREATFSMLESLLESRTAEDETGEAELWAGTRVLDLFAGTGALGIEALSRGASWTDFVEGNGAACQLIRDNLAHTKLAPRGRVYCTRVEQFVRQFAGRMERAEVQGYDLVLMDPPYADPTVVGLLGEIGSAGMLAAGGLLVVEHSKRTALPASVAGLEEIRTRRHGDTAVTIYAARQKPVTAAQ